MIRFFTSFSFAIASFNVSATREILLNLPILYATILLSYKSIIVDKYARFSLCIKYVMSVNQTLFGAVELKLRFIKLGLHDLLLFYMSNNF